MRADLDFAGKLSAVVVKDSSSFTDAVNQVHHNALSFPSIIPKICLDLMHR